MSRQSSDGLLYCDFCGAVVDESSEDPPFFNALAPVPTIFDADNNFTLCEACFNKIVEAYHERFIRLRRKMEDQL